MPEVHYSERYDTQASIMRPWKAPGGKNFLFRVLLWGAASYLLVFFFFGRGVLDAYMDMFRGLAALDAAGDIGDEAETLAMLSSVGKLYGSLFLVSVFGWIVAVSVETALHKNLFHGIDHGMFPLRLGRFEGRVFLTHLAIVASTVGIYFAMFLGMFVIGGLGSLFGGAVAALFALVMIIGVIAGLVFIMMLMVRLFPASAYGVKHDRLVIFEMWKKTKGYGWNIFGSALIVVFCGYIIMNILMVGGVSIIFGDMAVSGLFAGDVPDDPDALFEKMAETFDKTSVKISLGIFLIGYMVASLFWYMHIWCIGSYAADYISEREQR